MKCDKVLEFWGVECVTYRNRQAWLSARRLSVGASESPALFGLGYADQTPLSIYAEKLMGRNGEKSGDELIVGRLMEPSLRDLFTEITGITACECSESPFLYHDLDRPYMTATPDGIVCDDDAYGVLEMKMIGRHQAYLWENGPPLRTEVQLQHQMAVTGLDFGWIFGLAGTDVISKRYDRNEEFIDTLRDKVLEFWGCVQAQVEPPATDKKCDHVALRLLHPQDTGETKSLPSSMQDVFESFVFTQQKRKELQKQEDGFKSLLQQFLGDATYGEMPDGRGISWKTSTAQMRAKEAYEKTMRTFRVHKTMKG